MVSLDFDRITATATRDEVHADILKSFHAARAQTVWNSYNLSALTACITGAHKSRSSKIVVVAPELPSWNQIMRFLESFESLRKAFATV
jgi:hypothetical protein